MRGGLDGLHRWLRALLAPVRFFMIMFPKRLLALALFTALAVMPPCVLRAQWVQTNGLYWGNIGSFATDGHTLFLGITSGGGVFQSTNSGLNWFVDTEGIAQNDNLEKLLGSNGSEVFACGEAYTYYWSHDSARWIQVGYARETASFGYKDTDLFEGSYYGEIERSTDNGLTWTLVDAGLNPQHLYMVTSFAVIDSFLFAGADYGIVRSSDNGDHWTEMDSTNDSLNITCLFVSGENLFAGAGGVLLSTDYGEHWNDISNGLPSSRFGVDALAEIGSTLFAGTYGGGIYISNNNGSSWQSANSGLPNEYISALSVRGDTLLAGTIDGVFTSTDSGRTWSEANNGLISLAASSLIVAGNTLYASDDDGGDVLLYRTYDSGTHWTMCKDSVSTQSNYSLESISSLFSEGPNLYACNFGVFLTTDTGAFWASRSNGLPANGVICLAVKGTNLFAGTNSGVFVSTDSGASWSDANGGLLSASSITSLLVIGSHVVAGTGSEGVFVTSDNGQTWTPANDSLTDLDVNTLVNIGPDVFASTGGGIFRSNINSGLIWTSVGGGLGAPFAVSGNTLFAASEGSISASFDDGENWVEEDSGFNTNTLVESFAVYDSSLFVGLYPNGSSGPTIWRRPLSEMSTLPYKLGASADTLDLGDIPVGNNSLQTLTVSNVGKVPITILSFQLSPVQKAFSTSDLSGEVELNPGESFTLEVFFQPTTAGEFSANLEIFSEAASVNIIFIGKAYGDDGVNLQPNHASMLTMYPNPFSQSTQITFTSPTSGYAEVSIVNMLGVEVARLFSGELGAGEHSFEWDAGKDACTTGMYECLVRMNGQMDDRSSAVETLPVVLMR